MTTMVKRKRGSGKRGPTPRTLELARRCREEPGAWHILGEFKNASTATSVAYMIRQGTAYRPLSPGFTAVARKNVVYVSFGEPDE